MVFTLQDVREEFGISQDDLAKRSGLCQAAIAAMEKKGAIPRQDTCKKLARVYQVPAFVLRSLAVLASENVPDPGKNRELYLRVQGDLKKIVLERANGKKKS